MVSNHTIPHPSGSKYYSTAGKPGFVRAEKGYFLDDSVDLGGLDTTLLTMPKNEVERADPWQRLLLELTRECLESAGETNYRGKPIGTFVGSIGEDWSSLFAKDSQVLSIEYRVTRGCAGERSAAFLSVRIGISEDSVIGGSRLSRNSAYTGGTCCTFMCLKVLAETLCRAFQIP